MLTDVLLLTLYYAAMGLTVGVAAAVCVFGFEVESTHALFVGFGAAASASIIWHRTCSRSEP